MNNQLINQISFKIPLLYTVDMFTRLSCYLFFYLVAEAEAPDLPHREMHCGKQVAGLKEAHSVELTQCEVRGRRGPAGGSHQLPVEVIVLFLSVLAQVSV